MLRYRVNDNTTKNKVARLAVKETFQTDVKIMNDSVMSTPTINIYIYILGQRNNSKEN